MGERTPTRILAALSTVALLTACGQAAAPTASPVATAAATSAAPSPTVAATPTKAPAAYSVSGTIHITPKDTNSFDVSLVDPATHTLYIADRTNKGVDEIVNEKFVRTVGPMVGPNGLILLPDMQQIWAGDNDSTVKIVDLKTNTITKTIPTGGKKRADEGAYDQKDGIVMIANGDDSPPFITFINAKTDAVIGKLDLPDADGIEYSFFDDASGMFWQSVPSTKENKQGEVVQIDPKTMKIVKTLPEKECMSNGLAVGPSGNMLLVCNGDAIKAGLKAQTQIVKMSDLSVVATVPVGGGDLAVYDQKLNAYFVADSNMTSDGTKAGTAAPVLLIIDASTNKEIQKIPTAKSAHSVAFDPSNDHVYVIIPDKGIDIITKGS
jgi:DNA-binding beta-propeller fold protein YncE